MATRKINALLAATFASSTAVASVPANDWKPPTFHGPGLLCASAFTLKLQEGEKAVQGFPSVGVVPYTVESGATRFGVVEDWFSGDKYEGRKLFAKKVGGNIYTLKRVPSDTPAQGYLFVPASKKALKFTLAFYTGNTGNLDKNGKGLQSSLLARIAFRSGEPLDCLKNVNPA